MGVHPTSAHLFETNGGDLYLDELRSLIEANSDKVAAVGECGLDYDRLHFCNKETQLRLALDHHFIKSPPLTVRKMV